MKPMDYQPLPPNHPSRTDLQRSAPSSTKSRGERLLEAERVARKMLSAYPDYGKAGAEYLLSVTELLAEYPQDIQERIANHRTGVPSLTQFLPTAKDIIVFADQLMARKATADHYSSLRRDETPRLEYKGAYIPFPALWKAFADELDILRGRRFARLQDADRALALYGKEAAKKALGGREQQPGDAASGPVSRNLVPPTKADLDEIKAQATIPDAPFSPQFQRHLRDTGYAETLRSQGKPVPVWLQEEANV